MKLSSKRETQVTFHHAVAPQATENKLTRGNHREQMLSTTTSSERAREAGSGAVILFNLVVLEREDFCLHHLLPNRWKTFFPSLWFLSVMLSPVESRNSGI